MSITTIQTKRASPVTVSFGPIHLTCYNPYAAPKSNVIYVYKQQATHPRFLYSNHDILRRNHAISIDDIREVVLHIVANAPPPTWIKVENVNLINRTVALFIPGLTPEILGLPPLPTSAIVNPNIPISIPLLPPTSSTSDQVSLPGCIPFIANTFSHACPTRAPGDSTRMHSVLSSFFSGPVTGEEKKRRQSLRAQTDSTKADPKQYLLTLDQMIENDYPIPSYMAEIFQKPDGWLETPKPAENESHWNQKIYAIDCEMCITEDGKELTRVCVIDYTSGKVIYDQLVKPRKPILDYLTRWSGITAAQLDPVTTTFEEVQAHVMSLLSPPPLKSPKSNPFRMPSPTSRSSRSRSRSPKATSFAPPPTPIVIGHSLESDLKALKICHPLCIDTALIYHHPRGRPLKPGLAWLTKKWCNREIQTRGEGGHDPEEDARACLDLFKKKLELGSAFGEFKVDFESVFERMARVTARDITGGVAKVKTAVVDHGNPSSMHGSKATTAIGCASDDEVLDGITGAINSHQFVYGRFLGLANTLGWITPKSASDTPENVPVTPPPSAEELAPVLKDLNRHLTALHASLPPRTAFLIFTGHSDPRKMAQLNARKSRWETALKSGKSVEEVVNVEGVRWTTADTRELEEQVELARRGLVFLGIKQ
ncbi:ribonuclease H [Crepidotus variabilis]|uniref:Ribonuclease H n=1 Tax=Crepidotus variabilis TaxID=179855 RepID=A0A9P6ECK5_9AGAR|nr:ribonuclease H [Crepidotus variabilis]